MPKYWIFKTEPSTYSYTDLLKDKKTNWNGIRNYQARNNLKSMEKNDKVLVYHSGKNKEIIGIAEVLRENYQDPKDKTNTWIVVELIPLKKLHTPFRLEEIKKEKG